LLKRAKVLGHHQTADAALHLLVGGWIVMPEVSGPTHRFRRPPAACGVRLLSRTAIPAHTREDSNDVRNLGVAVARVVFDGETIPLDDARLSSGWHDIEAGDGKDAAPASRSPAAAFLRSPSRSPSAIGSTSP
jgi:hypothetical protein